MRIPPAFSLAFVLALAGCSGQATRPAPKTAKPIAQAAPANYDRPCADAPATPAAAFDCDRKSILAMAGEFRVRFAFDETVALAPGYAPHDPQRSGGTERVEVIADSGERISLQHILVLGKDHTVVKHWRQDWLYQPKQMLHFLGNGHFETRAVPAEDARGAWSQTVYEVDDAPRYAGVGRWTHADGEDSWAARTLRPLPRREYTKRSDYQAIAAINRHTITPAGWVHEQENTKVMLDVDGHPHALAREIGVNSYTRIHDYDFGAGHDYWNRTASFWAAVRTQWDRLSAEHAQFTTSPEPNGEPRIEEFFDLAERAEKGETIADAEIRAVFDKYVETTAPGQASHTP